MNDQITRRSALRTGALATLMAGVLGTAGAPATEAAPAPASDLVAALCQGQGATDSPRVVAWMKQWNERRAEYHAVYQPLADAFGATLMPAQWHLYFQIDNLDGLGREMEHDRHMELLCAHLPGIAPMLRTLYAHVVESHHNGEGCCAMGEPFGVADA